jgi:hypothetical protein
MMIPAAAINKTGIHSCQLFHVNEFVQNGPDIQKAIMECDLLVVERNFFQDVNVLCAYWYARNKVIMSLYDDDYPGILHDNVSFPFWTKGEIKYKDAEGKDQTGYMMPPPLEQLARGTHFTAGLQTVSQQLADDWAHLTDTYVINNHLPIEEYMNVEPLIPHDKDTIVLGWSGSLSHFSSFSGSGALNSLKYVVRKYPQVKILISGDKRVWDEIPVPKDKKFFQPFVPADKYKPLVKSFDIYMIPLATEYDKRRSWIKALECCALKIPWVATDFPTYANIKQYGHVTPNGSKQWTEAISQAIENLTEYRKFAEEVAYPFSLTQSIDLHVQERIDLYQHVIEKGYRREQRPELSILPYNQLPGYVKP